MNDLCLIVVCRHNNQRFYLAHDDESQRLFWAASSSEATRYTRREAFADAVRTHGRVYLLFANGDEQFVSEGQVFR